MKTRFFGAIIRAAIFAGPTSIRASEGLTLHRCAPEREGLVFFSRGSGFRLCGFSLRLRDSA
jgi:hypothetical protein